ncbi:integrase arm-type DNA-binding domain-containing protein [Rhodobacterales bacterium HKCCSP123]|nr:integrase arm-type DNA-binding domain-containing protein [Rhodobacterales bacterium HKCCSP123]
MGKLTKREVDSLRTPGMHGDGDGLYLNVSQAGSKSWVLRTRIKGESARREFGLGSVDHVPLAEAREKARELRAEARRGKNPKAKRDAKPVTFEDAARKVHANLLPTFRSEKHGEVWLASLERHAFPRLGSQPIETIGMTDVLAVLSCIWTAKHDTARRIKQRIGTIFDWAKGAGHYLHENPVAGIEKSLPKVKHRAQHMASLPWQELPAFMSDLSEREGVSARTLEFVILTGVRSGEARGARWSEIEDGVWTIPAERMKMHRAHRVPLSAEALAVLEQVRGLDAELVFPSVSRGRDGKAREQSVNVFKALFGRMGRESITAHGFRSTFRDWATLQAKAPWEVAEAALAHEFKRVERAYIRDDLLEPRSALMDAWGRYATGKTGNVVEMVRA